jgi:alkaline phosphatase D
MYWYDLFERPLSRRDMLRVGRDVAACIALSSLPMPGGGRRPRALGNPFIHGVASGDPSDTSVVLWTRLDPALLSTTGSANAPLEVVCEVAADESFSRPVRRLTAPAVAELGHSVHIEAQGLEPGRDYWFRFNIGGEASIVGRTRTAPAPGSEQQLRFAFASCQNYEHGYFTAYRHMVADQPDFVVHLGDYIYERTFGTNNVRQHEAGEVFTLDQYRARYALYRSDPDLLAAHQVLPFILTVDDHEIDNNYAADLSEDNRPREEFRLRMAAAYQAYYEFMPLRRSSLPRGPGMQLYRRLDFGNMLSVNVLDTRQYRGNQPCDDGTKARCAESLDPALTLLGDAQEQWLFSGMRASRARWNVLANQIMISEVARGPAAAPTFSMDQWAGYFHARKRVLDFLASARPSNPVVITGDIHSNWVSDIKADFADPNSAVVGAEFVGTSITSGADGSDATGASNLARNPHLKHYSNRRGYVLNTVSQERWTAQFRTVPFVTREGAPIETKATFVVENGRPGVLPG